MADAPRKRSRFDRRSRSPESRPEPSTAGDRNGRDDAKSPASNDAAAATAAAIAAKAAAARISAQIQAKLAAGGIKAPTKPQAPSPVTAGDGVKSPSGVTANKDEIYQQDGDFIRDIEVNDLRNRYTLTKGSTQRMIKEKTGADVTTRGAYYPDKAMATNNEPPLYLHITSQSKEGLEKAVAEIEALMSQDLPNLIDERRFRRREPEQQVERDERGRRKWPEEKILINLEPAHGFNLRAQVVGQGGSYVKHIQQETRCRVQIKGRDSGFIESDTGRESDEQMYLHVAGPDADQVQRAKQLCLELLDSVREQYEAFKQRGMERRAGGGGGGGGYNNNNTNNTDRGNYGGGSSYGGAQGYDGGSAYGGGYSSVQSPMPATPAGLVDPVTASADPAQYAAQWQQWQQTNPQEYAAYMQAYQQSYAAYYGGQQQPQGEANYHGYDQASVGAGQAPPPPQPEDVKPIVNSDFTAVPPPPGM